MHWKERRSEEKFPGLTVTNFHSEDQTVIKTASHLLAIREQIKCRLCGLRSCLWQGAQEISLLVKSQNLLGATSTACAHTKITTGPARSCAETHCVRLAKPPELPLPMSVSGIQSPFWLPIEGGLGRPPHLQKEQFGSCVGTPGVPLLVLYRKSPAVPALLFWLLSLLGSF